MFMCGRTDLLRAAILGPAGTPYHDGLFVFDIKLPDSYPASPPEVRAALVAVSGVVGLPASDACHPPCCEVDLTRPKNKSSDRCYSCSARSLGLP